MKLNKKERRGKIMRKINKAYKIAYTAFKFICKEGAKYLWNNHRVFLAVSLSSLIFIALDYKVEAFELIMLYSMFLFWKIIFSYLFD
jgi:hypothetical protein